MIQLKDSSLLKTEGFINGYWTKAKSGKTFEVTNPANDKVIANVAEMTRTEAKEAIDHAATAFKTWSQTTAKERHDLMMKFYKAMIDNVEDLGHLITLENGKPLADAKGEVTYGASFIEWFAEEAVRAYGDVIPHSVPGTRIITLKQPVGVVGIITPWNFPVAMITRKLGAALAAGCTVVMKPAGETPLSALAMVALAERVGIPKGVINVVTGLENTKDLGLELTTNPVVRKISFTGSTGVGKILMKQASDTMKKVSFELGGNAPLIVFDDADIDAAVDGAVTCKFRSSGQTCVCANRIYVQDSIYAEFASKLADKVSKFKVGDGLSEGITHGPLIHARAVDKVRKHVEDAVSKGAEVLVGGKALEKGNGIESGNYFAPTVISGATADMDVAKEETFGPLAPLFKFKTEEEVLKLANDTDVGLAGYFFARDIGRIWRVAEALEVGMIGLNTGLISNAAAPFG